MALQTPTISRERPSSLDTVGSVVSPSTGSIVAKECGTGAVRQTVLTLTNVPLTLVDNGTNGSGSTPLYTMPNGVIKCDGAVTDLVVSYGSVSDANLIGAIGTVAAAADGTLSSTEANLAPSTACATTSGVGSLKAKPTGVAYADGTSTAAVVRLNMATSSDPSTNNSITVTGTVVVTWTNLGDS